MRLECFELSMAGDKAVNQDYSAQLINDEYGLFMVADGLGGHQAGEKASRYFCQGMLKSADIYKHAMTNRPAETLQSWINTAVDEMKCLFANDKIANDAYTTCAVLFINKNLVVTAHCGDSRIYRMTPSQILWRTKDHSVTQNLLDLGCISEHEMAQRPEQNQLIRSISVNNMVSVEIGIYPTINENETFLLCSDGFWANISTDELLQVSNLSSNKENLAKLGRMSKFRAKGKCDNVTAQAVRCKQSTQYQK